MDTYNYDYNFTAQVDWEDYDIGAMTHEERVAFRAWCMSKTYGELTMSI
jgi:hypothetical protein